MEEKKESGICLETDARRTGGVGGQALVAGAGLKRVGLGEVGKREMLFNYMTYDQGAFHNVSTWK